ncbi:BRO family protein [uncultured Subdoligranulum sp.]|uniref:BRO family protein n=1 Tax=uncultured Subdoligranulum sp. TaxID=512298 RepID=UPI002622F613|nr:BRO family protein [uncultured Subdoligranulum sp.]
MNELQIFNNAEFGGIRGLEINDEPWFVGKDVAGALGYADTDQALRRHVDDEDKLTRNFDGSGQARGMTIINESGLYSLVLSSKLPTARKFKRWITSEVIPSIRKHGGYLNGQNELSPEELMAKALMVAQQTLADREKRIAELTVTNQIMAPKADYFDELVDRNLLTNFRETAKQLGVKEKVFIQFLLDKKYIYRDKRGKLMPYAEKNSGLFEIKEQVNEKTGWAGTQTLITPKGRETFRLLYLKVA